MPSGLKAVGLEGFQKWFKPDKVTIDNWVFRLHHQVNFAVLMVGLIFIFIENHLNGKSITCRNDDSYANKFCWIHGTGHVSRDLQGKVTPCTVDQAGLDGEENNVTITYYLWLPFLLVFLLGLSKLARTVWKSLEESLIESLIRSKDSEKIGKDFLDKCYKKKYMGMIYHLKYFFCEILNMASIVISMWICNQLFNGKFWSYGSQVIDFMKIDPETVKELTISDPKCNLFPTEVSCQVRTGSISGGTDEKNLICILSNNIFNQHYFFILWIWWVVLLIISGIGLVFRVTRIVIPDFSRKVFIFKHGNVSIVSDIDNGNGGFSRVDFFILDRIAENLELEELENLLKYIQESSGRSNLAGVQNGKDKLMDNL